MNEKASIKITRPTKLNVKDAIFATIAYLLRIPNIVFYILLFISLLVIEYFNFHLSPDTSIQFHTLNNFISGHGITLTSVDTNGNVVYLPVSSWPAGLVIFLSPIFLITKDAVTAGIVMKLIGNVFFILFLAKYFDYLKLNNSKRKFIILFFIVAISPFIEFYVSDTLAMVLCLWGFYFNLQYQDNGKFTNILLSLMLLGLAYFVKYSFLPFLLYPICSFILKEKLNVFKKINSFLIICISTIAIFFLFYFLNSSLVGKMQLASSFDALAGKAHWSQLLRFDGFLFTFGIYEWVFQNLVKGQLGINFDFNWLSILVTIYFYFILIKYFFSKRNLQSTRFQNSINISLSAGALIIGFLTFLTLNNPGQTWATPYWTFVQETRYYSPVIIVCLVNILILFLIKKKGSLLHIIVPLMFVLNLYAIRTVIQRGFWGKNYQSFLAVKKDIDTKFYTLNDLKETIVYFEKDTKNSDPYYYLKSRGIILIEKSEMKINKRIDNKFEYFNLEKEATNSDKIILTN